MQNSWSYLKYSEDFLKKRKSISSIPEDTTLVTANVVSLLSVVSIFSLMKVLNNNFLGQR